MDKAAPVFKHHTTKANRGIGHNAPYILISAEWPISRFGYFTHGKCDSASVE
jgi:hypothetical protein